VVTDAPRAARCTQRKEQRGEHHPHDYSAAVNGAAVNGAVAHIVVNDIAIAKRELLRSAVAKDLVLTHYTMARPSLEDVFLPLVSEGRTAT